LYCIKLERVCTAKQTVTRPKRQPIEWKKIFATYIPDQELITETYRQLKKLTLEGINNPLNKWANELNRQFSKEETKNDQRIHKKCLISLVIKEMQIKMTLRFHPTPVRMATIKNTNNNKC
jgi:hypothetical protein